MIAPSTFVTRPDPWIGSIVNVPVPACVIVPPSLSSDAGLSVQSVLRVWIVPPLELSSAPITAIFTGSVPSWLIVPCWFVRSVAAKLSAFAAI